jgi:hypothetical protein
MTNRLAGCQAKIKRAGLHLKMLNTEMQAWIDSHPYRFVTEVDPETGEGVVVVRAEKADEQPPLDWGVTVGDIAHNLRSALDHLVCQLAMLDGADCGATQFPICDTPEAWAAEMWKKRLKGLDLRHQTRIKRIQPYHRRKPGIHLAVLRDLSNADKHRLINPVNLAMAFVPPTVDLPRDVLQLEVKYKERVRMEDGAEYARITNLVIRTGSQVQVKFSPTYNILFGQEGEWEISRRSLYHLRDHVRRVVHRFAGAFVP